MLRIAAASTLVVTFMAQVALAQSGSGSNSGSNFANCLCYNQQTQSFCHGHEWYNSEACQDWLAADFNWILVIFAFVCLMFAFPFLFCCSRFCCQCCGGNKPTRGCCCSDQSTQAIFPGYTNRSIALTRGAYLIGFCLAIATTFVSWNHNNNLHTATNEAVSTLQQGVQQLQQYGQAVNTVATYAATPNNYLAQAPVVPVNMDTIHTVSNTVSTIHDAENNDGYGRAHLTTVLSFWALVVPVVAFIPMACSWKSSMNVFLVIQCLIATILLIAVMPLGALAEVVEESCNNWNTVTQPFITGAMQEAGVGSTMQQADNLYNYIFNNVLNAPLPQSGSSSDGSAGTGSASSSMPTTFCADVQAVCLAIGGCATTPCTASNAQSVAYGCNGGYSQQFTTGWSFNQQMTSFMNSVCSGKQQTIVTAAATNAKAQAIVNFANAVSGFEHVTGSQSPYSGWVMNMLNNVEWPLCARVRGHAKNVAISIGVQYLVALVMMVAIFLGIKRFAKWNSYNPYAEYIGLGTEAAPVITAIVVEINHDAPWSPSPNGYAESPVGGYTEAC